MGYIILNFIKALNKYGNSYSNDLMIVWKWCLMYYQNHLKDKDKHVRLNMALSIN